MCFDQTEFVCNTRSHNKVVQGVVLNGELIECVDELKYLGSYILSAKSFTVSLHYMRVRLFQSFNSLYAKSYCFSFECVTFVIFCTYLSSVYHSTVQYSVNKGFYKTSNVHHLAILI